MTSGYEILCWGDGLYLWRVLNGLAMLSNSGSLGSLALTGAIVGLFLAIVRAVTSNLREFPIVSVFLGAIFYIALFGPRATVIITPMNPAIDRTNVSGGGMHPGASMVVDNVPWGAAASGMILSQVGVRLAGMFEQVFSTPESVGVTRGGLAKTLSFVTSTRYLAQPYLPLGSGASAAANAERFANWKRSLSAYIHDCTLGGMNSAAATKPRPDRMFTQANPIDGIRFASDTWHTLSWMSSPEERVSCTVALTKLSSTMSQTMSDSMNQLMTARYGVPDGGGVQALTQALSAIGARASSDATSYMAASLINDIWDGSAVDGPPLSANVAATIALRQAEEQRTSDWVGGANLFLSSLRPVLAFFEALSFALAPFLVFMIGFGERGWKVLVSYVLLALWVQLWLPLLAVANLYLLTNMEHVAAGLQVGTSVADVNVLQTQATYWLGMGALFVQVTPFLALAVLYSGAVTATTLASRMAGHDYYNEKTQHPDLVQPAPMLQMESMNTYSSGRGLTQTGANLMRVDPSTSQTLSVGSAWSTRESAMATSLKEADLVAANNAALQHAFKVNDGSQESDGVTGSTAHAAGYTGAQSASNTVSGRATQTAGDSSSTRSSGSYGMGTPGLSVDSKTGNAGRVASAIINAVNFGYTRSFDDANAISDTASLTKGGDAGIQKQSTTGDSATVQRARAVADSISYVTERAGSFGLSTSDSEKLSKIAQDIRASDRTYNEAVGANTALSAAQPTDVGQLGQNALAYLPSDDLKAATELVRSAAPAQYEGLHAALAQQVGDAPQRSAAVTMLMLGQMGAGADGEKWAPELQERREALAAQMLPHVFPGASGASFHLPSAHANADLRGHAPAFGATEREVAPHVQLPDADHVANRAVAARGGANAVAGQVVEQVHAGPERLDATEARATTAVDDAHKTNEEAIKRAQLDVRRTAYDTLGDASNKHVSEIEGTMGGAVSKWWSQLTDGDK